MSPQARQKHATAGVPAVIRTVAALRARVAEWRRDRDRVGMVPTMGGLHAGHIALVRAAKAASDRVVVSLFVNPKQFDAPADFAGYPANEAKDIAMLAAEGVDVAFAPTTAEMYPPGFATRVQVAGLTEGLCGDFRPGHFAGVTTVVAKLLAQCLPDAAWFGEKDYQQLLAVRRMVRDLDLPVAIESHPTIRDSDGLALSSRNSHLSAEERRIAPALHRAISAVALRVKDGTASCRAACEAAQRDILAAGFAAVDYVEVRDADTLAPIEHVRRPARVLAAARLGKTRLIDNVPVP